VDRIDLSARCAGRGILHPAGSRAIHAALGEHVALINAVQSTSPAQGPVQAQQIPLSSIVSSLKIKALPIRYVWESLNSTDSRNASQLASIILSLTPTVPQICAPSPLSINTRVRALVLPVFSKIRTL